LIKDPEELIEKIEDDHGFRKEGERYWSPGKKVTKVSGVYATSKPLTSGHVGLNKLNPIYENIRNMQEQNQKITKLKFSNKKDDFTGRDIDQPELIVREESSPTKIIRNSQYLKEVTLEPSIIEERHISTSPTKIVKERRISSSPRKKI